MCVAPAPAMVPPTSASTEHNRSTPRGQCCSGAAAPRAATQFLAHELAAPVSLGRGLPVALGAGEDLRRVCAGVLIDPPPGTSQVQSHKASRTSGRA
jgi:hypothetical protein